MPSLTRNTRYAFRQLRANPGFTALAILSLAIGIGAPTTIFTLVNAILLRPLPVPDADRLVYAYESSADGSGFHSFSYPQWRDLSHRTRSMEGLTAFDNAPLSVVIDGGEPRVALGAVVTGNYFQVLGVSPQRGRFFLTEEDGATPKAPVAVVSDAFWRGSLAANPSVIGSSVRINGQPFTIIGVTRPEFASLSPIMKTEIFTTIGTSAITKPMPLDSRSYATFQIVGRLRAGVTREAAERELEGIAKQIEADNPTDVPGRGVDLHAFTAIPTEARRGIGMFMSLLMGFGALILFVACGNVASMLLARGIQRRRELAIRTALGATRAQTVLQLVIETVLLFLGGAAAALGLAFATSRAIVAFKPPVDIPISLEVPMDWRVFAFALGTAIVVGAFFGLVPGLRATRANLDGVLKDEAGAVSGRSRARSVVVVGQLALTFVLLVAAGLVGKALGGALRLDPGFDRAGIHVAMTDIEMGRLDDAQSWTLAKAWRDRVAGMPGVANAALTTRAPLSTGNSTISFKVVAGAGATGTEFQNADWAGISAEFFSTLGVRLVAGRGFGVTDVPSSERVAIVSEAFARRFFGEPARALGRVLFVGRAASPRVIVGVAADTKVRSLTESPRPMMYEPLSQLSVGKVTMLVRSDRADVAAVIRNELRSLNAAVPLMGSMSYDSYVAIALLPQRLAAGVTGILGLAGLLLAALGVYGIVAYAVTQRTREIGIRIAIGATAGSVVATMATTGLRLVAVGVGIGFVLSLAGTRLMSSFLLDVSPTDPAVFAGITLGLGVVATLACAIPARRAARVDPLVALRSN